MRLFLALTLLPLVAAPAQTLVITNKNESTASIITLADGKTVATNVDVVIDLMAKAQP